MFVLTKVPLKSYACPDDATNNNRDFLKTLLSSMLHVHAGSYGAIHTVASRTYVTPCWVLVKASWGSRTRVKGPSEEEVAEKRNKLREESPFSNPDRTPPDCPSSSWLLPFTANELRLGNYTVQTLHLIEIRLWVYLSKDSLEYVCDGDIDMSHLTLAIEVHPWPVVVHVSWTSMCYA